MRGLKLLTHPALVLFTAVTFIFLITGCERTVTKYDENGKPYTDKEFDPGGTLAAFVITVLVLGGIAAAASSSGGGTYLHNQNRPMLAYAGNRGYLTDASSGMYSSAKSFKLVDSEGNLISEHLIDVDRLMASKSLVNISDVQISSHVNKTLLRKLVKEIARANNLTSIPGAVKANVSYFSSEGNEFRLNGVSIPKNKSKESSIAELTVMSEKGICRATASLPEKTELQTNLSRDFTITVSTLN